MQRVVDNDKADSGGAKACTFNEFFVRFPDLYPFLVAQLQECVQSVPSAPSGTTTDVDGTGTETGAVDNLLAAQGTVHPSLFPVLLLLSKLRAPLSHTATAMDTATEMVMETEAETEEEAETETDEANGAVASRCRVFDAGVFIKHVEACLCAPSQKVREIASKAMASLTCVSDVSRAVMSLLQKVLGHVSDRTHVKPGQQRQRPSSFNSNLLHGWLLTAKELLESTYRHIGAFVDVSAVISGHAPKRSREAVGDVTVRDSTTVDSIYAALIEQLSTSILPQLLEIVECVSAVLLSQRTEHSLSPCVLRTLLHVLQTVRTMLVQSWGQRANTNKQDDSDCGAALQDIIGFLCFESIRAHGLMTDSGRLLTHSSAPFTDLYTYQPFLPLLLQDSVRELLFLQLQQMHAKSLEGADDASCVTMVHHIRQLLAHPTCEVREGCMLGLQRFDCSAGVGVGTFARDILLCLLEHVAKETKPSILNLSLELCIRWSNVVSMEGTQGSLFTEGHWKTLMCLVVLPASRRQSALHALAQGESRHHFSDVVSTAASANALQVWLRDANNLRTIIYSVCLCRCLAMLWPCLGQAAVSCLHLTSASYKRGLMCLLCARMTRKEKSCG